MSKAAFVRFAVLSGLAVSLAACGGDSDDGAPITTPSPAPTVAPAPSPTPTPVPGLGCNLGPGVSNASCSRDVPTYLNEVDEAINLLAQQQPEIFDFNQQRGGGGWLVKSQGRFYLGVMRNLEAKGLCSMYNGEGIQVKGTNAFDDGFNIVSGESYVRRGLATYRGTCYPASFPTSQTVRQPPPSDPCHLPPSVEVACQRETSTYLHELEAALDQVIREHPQIFDTNQQAAGQAPGSYKVLDGDAYLRELRRALGQRGFCTFEDGGEELVIKKTNQYSESYDVWLSFGFIRRGEGSYRGTCWPAFF